MARRRKQIRSLAIAALTAGVLIGTLFVLGSPEPEQVRAVSDDGRVAVAGFLREVDGSGGIVITRRDDLGRPFAELTSPAYEIASAPAGGRQALTLTAAYDAPDPVLYYFDRPLSAWQAYPSVADPAAQVLVAEIPAGGPLIWAVGRRIPFFGIPDEYDSVMMDELVSAPPQGAVGFRAFIARSADAGDWVVVVDELGRGGCGGRFRSGASRTITSLDRSFDPAVYRVGVVWELDGGCASGSAITFE